MIVEPEGSTRSQLLTRAYHRPQVLAGMSEFVSEHSYLSLAAQAEQPLQIRKGLSKIAVVNKHRVAWFLSLAIVLSIGSGVLVGFLTTHTDWGIEAGAGMVAIVTIASAILRWLLE